MTFLVNVVIAANTDTVRDATDPAPKAFEVVLSQAGVELARKSGMELTYAFAGLAEGDYSVSAVLLDAADKAIGETVVKAFTVRQGTTIVKTVSALSVTFTPE